MSDVSKCADEYRSKVLTRVLTLLSETETKERHVEARAHSTPPRPALYGSSSDAESCLVSAYAKGGMAACLKESIRLKEDTHLEVAAILCTMVSAIAFAATMTTGAN